MVQFYLFYNNSGYGLVDNNINIYELIS